MITIGIIRQNRRDIPGSVKTGLKERGFYSWVCDNHTDPIKQITANDTDVILLIFDAGPETIDLLKDIKQDFSVPVLIMVEAESLGSLDPALNCDDFMLAGAGAGEIEARIRRALKKAATGGVNTISYGDLSIDMDSCEVWLDGRLIPLTYREFQLLKFLIGSPGIVFDRNTILNRVWGYDYFGGDRTVDVHIRRLRSKIEDSRHTFIDTVRNMGYRFRKEL